MKVLIIEDDAGVVEVVARCFEMRWPGVTVLSTGEGAKGTELVEAELPDIVILDLGLPDINGFEVLRQIRFFSDVPIFILTVRDQKPDIARGLESGADDYLTKPFDYIEFLARVKAMLRRSGMGEFGSAEPFQSGNLWIDFSTREVRLGGEVVKLSPIEYSLLSHLARNAGHVVTHRTLLEKVWGTEYTDATDYLKVYIQRLRVKLCNNLSVPKLILTEWGVGYKLAKRNQALTP